MPAAAMEVRAHRQVLEHRHQREQPRMPTIVFSVVDLPDALPPSRQTSWPDLERPTLQDVDLVVEQVDAVDLQERGHVVAVAGLPRYASTTRESVAT